MNAEIKPAKHSAPGQYLGFALQPVRLFYHLLTCPKGAKVSLELQDDIAIHYADGSLCLEQTKSALKQNPISDWAADFWKAFHNWLTMVQSKDCDANVTRFRLYVTPGKNGAFASALARAKTADEAEVAVAMIRDKLAKEKKAPACATHLQPFLDAPNDQRIAIITNFELEANANDPLDAVRERLVSAVAEHNVDIIVKSGIGQAKQAIDRLIQRGEIPILDADEFRRNFVAFVRQNNLPALLTSLAEVPSDDLVAGIASARPIFIQQLELVEVNNDDRMRAVSDYLRASADKSDWAERGLIFPGSLDVWDDDLIRKHGMIRGDIADLHGDKGEAIRGRLLYRQCAQHQAPLEGRAVPGHFVHGSFNDLADRRLVGWHPEYEKLLDGDNG